MLFGIRGLCTGADYFVFEAHAWDVCMQMWIMVYIQKLSIKIILIYANNIFLLIVLSQHY